MFTMNKVVIIGRLVRTPEVKYSQGNNPTAVARYTLAVDRRFRKEGEPTADFINCIAFGKLAELTKEYVSKGNKIAVVGHIRTGSYTNKDGNKVYTTDVIVDEIDFCESKGTKSSESSPKTDNDRDFVPIDGIDDEETPF